MKSASINEIKKAIKHIEKLEAEPDYVKAYTKIYHYLHCGVLQLSQAGSTLDEHAIVTAKGARQVFKNHYFIDKKVKPGDSHWDDDIDFNTNAYVSPQDYHRMEKESHHLSTNELYVMLFSRDFGDYNPPTEFPEADSDMCERVVDDAINELENSISSRIKYNKQVAKYHHAIKFVKNCRAALKNTPQSIQATANKLVNYNSSKYEEDYDSDPTAVPSDEFTKLGIQFKNGKAIYFVPNTIVKNDKIITVSQRAKPISYDLLKAAFSNMKDAFKEHEPILL